MRSLLKKNPNKDISQGRIARWYFEFIGYDFEIEWIKGENNPLPDALTRELARSIYDGLIFNELDWYKQDGTPMYFVIDENSSDTGVSLPYLSEYIVELLLESYFLNKWLLDRSKINCYYHHQGIVDPDEEDDFHGLIGLENALIRQWCGNGNLHIRIKGLFGMNWFKRNKMNLLKNLKYGFISRISFDQDTFEEYTNLIGARFNPNMIEFLNLIHPQLWNKMYRCMIQYLTHPTIGYHFPRIELYPLEEKWKPEVRIEDMEIKLKPTSLSRRIEMDCFYSHDYVVQLDYVFQPRNGD